MKETGLMFKAPLVRAILDRSKTQTRRLVKWKGLQPGLNLGFSGLGVAREGSGWVLVSNSRTSSEWRCHPTPSPVGQPGDRIYVRETWRGIVNIAPPGSYEYAVARYTPDQEHCRRVEYAATHPGDNEPWRPSIHLPKWAARIWLEIAGVRVERLQSISEVDCRAEGAHGGHGSIPGYAYSATPQEHFQHIWESTGGDWASNPCVWVIDFKQIPLPREQGS